MRLCLAALWILLPLLGVGLGVSIARRMDTAANERAHAIDEVI